MEPFDSDRHGADLTGASRLDRLRARGGDPVPAPAARPVAAWVAVAVLLAFALGLIANPWFERSVRSRLPGFAPTLAPTVADVAALNARISALERRPLAAVSTLADTAAATPAQGERLARVETRVETLAAMTPAEIARIDQLTAGLAALTGRIDATSASTAAALTTATTTADRAQAMLVVVAARRQIEAGGRLGALEPALRRVLGARAPQPVEAVAALGAAPVTPASLRAGLDQLRPALTGVAIAPGTPRSWWDGFRDMVSGVVVRQTSSNPDAPSARVARASRALGVGNTAAAAAEIAALPSPLRAKAQGWLAAVARLQAGQRGLAQLDAMLLDAALLDPPSSVALAPA